MEAADGREPGAGTQAAAELMLRYREPLLRRIRWMMGPAARRQCESIDFLQQVFAAAVEHAPQLSAMDDVRRVQWLTAVARNRVREAVRGPRERALASLSATLGGLSPAAASQERPDRGADALEQATRLVECLEQLKDEYRTVIELRDFDALSFRDIAARLGRTENAAQILHTRAMVRLSELVRRRLAPDRS